MKGITPYCIFCVTHGVLHMVIIWSPPYGSNFVHRGVLNFFFNNINRFTFHCNKAAKVSIQTTKRQEWNVKSRYPPPQPRQSSHVSAVYSSSKSNHPSDIYPPRLRAAILQSTISRCILSMCQSSHIHAIYTPNQNKQSSAVYLPWVRAPMLPPFTWPAMLPQFTSAGQSSHTPLQLTCLSSEQPYSRRLTPELKQPCSGCNPWTNDCDVNPNPNHADATVDGDQDF